MASTPVRAAGALVAASALAFVLATSVFTTFAASRAKVVPAPISPVAGGVALTDIAPPPGGELAAPFALITRIRNDSPSAETFNVRLAGVAVCRPTVPARTTTRVDCASPAPWNGPVSVTITAERSATPWTLAYLEFATHHGATQAYDLVVIPARSRNYVPVPAPAVALAFLVFFIVAMLPGSLPGRFHLRRVHAAVAVLAAVFLALVAAARFVSPYAVLLSVHAFAWCVVVIAAPRLWFLYESSAKTFGSRVVKTVLAAAVVAVCFGALAATLLSDVYHGNPSGFFHISRMKFDQDPLLAGREDVRRSLVLNDGAGYDGEYMYFAMYDPLLRHYTEHAKAYNTYIDAVPYRYDRIGYIWLTRLLAWSRWQAYPATMEAIVFASLLVCAALVARVAADGGASPFWGAAVVLIPGFWQSLQDGLPEPLAAALLLGGYLCVKRRQLAAGAALCACALLVRETGLIFVLAIAAIAASSEPRMRRALFFACAVAPAAMWRLYVGTILLKDWGPNVFFYQPGNMTMPLSGIRQVWATLGTGAYDAPSLQRAGMTYSVLLILAAVLAVVLSVTAWNAAAIAALGYAAMALCFDFNSVWIHVGNAQRITFDLFMMLLLATIELRARSRAVPWLAAAFWAAAALYVFWGAFDAPYIRAAMPV